MLLDLCLLLYVLSTQLVRTFGLKNPSDSILDLINTKEVERIIAERNDNDEKNQKSYLLRNDLEENYQLTSGDYGYQRLKFITPEVLPGNENPRIDLDVFLRRNNYSEPFKKAELLGDLRGYNGRKLLKSSKNALYVTKKEYLQKDWCKTEPLIQKVKEEGCLTRTVINRFCYGQCNSFYIPKNPKRRNRRKPILDENEEEDKNGPAFKSCGFCRPYKFTWVTVTLRCPNYTPQFRKKRIQRIKQCKCMPANLN